MEKIKIRNMEYEIVSIRTIDSNLLEIVFLYPVDLSYTNLSKIELYTEGGVKCAEITGYTTIYNVDGNKVILSKDGSVKPISDEPAETDPPEEGADGDPGTDDPGPSEIELRLQEIDAELTNISNIIVMLSMTMI